MKILVFIVWCGLSSLILAKDNLCYRCYEQKAVLAMHCLSNPSLYALYPQWCQRISIQAKLLHVHATYFDALLQDKRVRQYEGARHFAFISNKIKMQLPYDPCDACFNNLLLVQMGCQLKRIHPKSFCRHQVLSNTFTATTIFRYYPLVLAEPLKE